MCGVESLVSKLELLLLLYRWQPGCWCQMRFR